MKMPLNIQLFTLFSSIVTALGVQTIYFTHVINEIKTQNLTIAIQQAERIQILESKISQDFYAVSTAVNKVDKSTAYYHAKSYFLLDTNNPVLAALTSKPFLIAVGAVLLIGGGIYAFNHWNGQVTINENVGHVGSKVCRDIANTNANVDATRHDVIEKLGTNQAELITKIGTSYDDVVERFAQTTQNINRVDDNVHRIEALFVRKNAEAINQILTRVEQITNNMGDKVLGQVYKIFNKFGPTTPPSGGAGGEVDILSLQARYARLTQEVGSDTANQITNTVMQIGQQVALDVAGNPTVVETAVQVANALTS